MTRWKGLPLFDACCAWVEFARYIALLAFCCTEKIPVSSKFLHDVVKADIIRAGSHIIEGVGESPISAKAWISRQVVNVLIQEFQPKEDQKANNVTCLNFSILFLALRLTISLRNQVVYSNNFDCSKTSCSRALSAAFHTNTIDRNSEPCFHTLPKMWICEGQRRCLINSRGEGPGCLPLARAKPAEKFRHILQVVLSP